MLIKASQYFEITSFSINFTSVFINTCVDSQMNLHKDNFLMSFYKHLILLYNTSIMPAFTEEEKRILLQTGKVFHRVSECFRMFQTFYITSHFPTLRPTSLLSEFTFGTNKEELPKQLFFNHLYANVRL